MVKKFTHRSELVGLDKQTNIAQRKNVYVRKIKSGWICSDGNGYDRYGYCNPNHLWQLDIDKLEAL
jgi:hypothetical protein